MTQTSAGERRQISVMFCDMVGFTEMSRRLDPEDLRDVTWAFRQACTDVIAAYGGHVAQALGDGLLAYFGWPDAHEDDAERAVRAALDVVEAVARVRATEPLRVHIGIATGPVVVGPSNDDRGLAIGETPNLAQRLEAEAGANQILIAPATRRLVGNVFDLREHEFAPPGFPRTRAWWVVGTKFVESRFDPAALSPLVGREQEIDILLENWQQATERQGRVVFIGGEPGIGKSRLTQVLRERIADTPHRVLHYQCSSLHSNAALYPVIGRLEATAQFARTDSPEVKLEKLAQTIVGSDAQREQAAPLLAALLSLPTDGYPSSGLSPQKQKDKLLEILIDQVAIMAADTPLLIVLEDAHWIDPTTQQLLDLAMPRLRMLGVMVIVTYRVQQYAPRVDDTMTDTILLTALTDDESAQLARNVARKELPAEVLAQLVAHASGVPLFVEELIKALLESGLLVEEPKRYVLVEPLVDLAIPLSLNALLVERLGRRERVRELAQIGACIGPSFSYELMAALEGDVDEDLDHLTRTELVLRKGEPPAAVYTFRHALVQDAAYNLLLKRERHTLHARIADVLERDFPRSVENEPAVIARHRTEAGQLALAIPLWRKAGEDALARMALQEAWGYFEKGLGIIQRLDASAERDNLELSLRESLHAVLLRWRGWAASEVAANATAILWLAQKQRRPHSLLVGLWGIWVNTITQGRVAEALDWARRLLEQGKESADPDLQILGYRACATSHYYLGQHALASGYREHAFELYGALTKADPRAALRWTTLTGSDVRVAVGIFACQSVWMNGYVAEAIQLSNRKDDDARRNGHPFDIAWALTWGAYVFDYLRQPRDLLVRAQEADRVGREQSIPVVRNILVPMCEGLGLLRQGHLRPALTSLRRARDGWRGTGGHLNLPYLTSAIAEAMALLGDVDPAVNLLDEALDQMAHAGWNERAWLPETLRLKGWVLKLQGKRAEAEANLRTALTWARRQEARSWELRAATTLGELLNEGEQREAAQKELKPVYDFFQAGPETYDLAMARQVMATGA